MIVLILDIKDTFSGAGVYVAGYFSSNNEIFGDPNSNRAEVYYVDANPLNLETSQGIRTAMRTAAHELQHMIHWGKDPGEQIFFNEGVPGARLDSIRVAMTPMGSITGGIYRFTGTVRPTPLGTRLAPDFVATRTGSAFLTTVEKMMLMK